MQLATEIAEQEAEGVSSVGDMSRIPVGGRLFKFRVRWRGAAYESVIKKGLSWTWEEQPPPPEEFQQQTSVDLDILLRKMRKKDVIEKAKIIRFQSRVFTVPKKDSAEGRWVMDLSKLNAFIKCPKFRMLTMREVKLLLPRGFWSVSLDLKDGYWHVPVAPRKRPYLGFRYKGQNWQFRAMPFGLNIAPRIFTKVMAHIVKVMATKGIWCLPYLDDLLILAPTKEECLHHLDKAVKILEEFGWIINQEKSRKQPAQIFEWLGIHVDLKDHTVSATQAHMEDLQEQLKSVIKSKYTSKRKIMRMQGLANWIGQNNKIIRLMVSQTKNFDKSIQKTKIRYTITPNKRHETQPNQMVEYTKNSTSTRKPNTVSDNPNRCIINRLGNENQQQNIPRNFRSFNGKLVNKCSRTSDHMVCITNGQREEPSDTSSMRQLNSSCSSQTKFFHNFSFSNDLRTNMEESNYDGLDTDSSTHPRQIQYHCRPVEQESYTVNRMVTTSKRFQNDSENEPKTSGRPICYSLESQAKDLHIPMSRSTSGGHRCHGSAMGQMETSVPLSPVIADFEGFSQIDGNQVQKCYSNNPGNANQTLVHGIETTSNTINSDESSPTTSSSEQDGKSNQPDQTSRLEVIKAGYSKQHPLVPPEGIALMSKPVGGTSINEYQRKWRAFISFLKREKISFEQVTIDSVLNFLYFLFYTRKLSLSTVALYRTALSVPMLIYFQIDLNVKAVTDLLRGMSHERPKKPPSMPTWSLNKVLTFLENVNNNINQTMLLKKTAFLLLLATGWRISELHACVRDKEFCSFTSNGILRIRPHPSFLGKNEKPQNRWSHTEIKVLKLRNGSISKICPVTTLRSYLQRTSKYKKGKLFLPPEKHQKKMSIYSLSKHICEVILMADPGVRARVHDVRKYAASLSFTNTMATEDLMQAMNWSSPVTFFKFYFCQTEPLDRPVTLPITESLN